jgi:predicted SPOUT superfamily RNA methylase MTH1
VLQYLETPPYLRSQLIPKDPELAAAAELPAIQAQQHLKDSEWLPYR